MKYLPATLSCGTSAFCINLENSEISQKFYHQISKKLFPTRRKSRDRDCVEWHRAKAFRVKIHSQHEAVPTEKLFWWHLMYLKWTAWKSLRSLCMSSEVLIWKFRFIFLLSFPSNLQPLKSRGGALSLMGFQELRIWWDFQALFKYVTTLSLKTGLEIESAQKAPLKLGLIKYLLINIY